MDACVYIARSDSKLQLCFVPEHLRRSCKACRGSHLNPGANKNENPPNFASLKMSAVILYTVFEYLRSLHSSDVLSLPIFPLLSVVCSLSLLLCLSSFIKKTHFPPIEETSLGYVSRFATISRFWFGWSVSQWRCKQDSIAEFLSVLQML